MGDLIALIIFMIPFCILIYDAIKSKKVKTKSEKVIYVSRTINKPIVFKNPNTDEKKQVDVPIKPIIQINFQPWKDTTLEYLDNCPSLSDLIICKEIDTIYYSNLLNCFEWKFKRHIILLRDNFECVQCRKKDVSNHVHHKYYLKDKLPWDIDNTALMTLCRDCHRLVHLKAKIPVYKIINKNKSHVSDENSYCERCDGVGYLAKYSHVEKGVCFKCNGNLVSKNVFSNALNEVLRNLNSYDFDSYSQRNEYAKLINNISIEEFLRKIPNAESYIEKRNDDDLPF